MEETRLFFLPEGMLIDQIQIRENEVSITVIATHLMACCPLCTQSSSSLHSHYRRVLRDAPCAGRCVQLFLTVRKFYCRNPLCERKVFTERLPQFVEPWARMTIRYCEQLTSLGLATCGNGGARLAAHLGIHTSRQTILRHVMKLPDISAGSILYLGIDDFAFRRGSRFGTILVDLESHRVVDLLADRQMETSAAWMSHHPDLFVVSRDRASAYASAVSEAAPQALQVADRFHLLKNLTDATQVLLARCHAEIREASKHDDSAQDGQTQQGVALEEWRPLEPTQVENIRLARRAGRYEHYQQVKEWQHRGMKAKEIAKRLDLSDRTVQRWMAENTFPEVRKRRKKHSCFDAFAPYVLKRWREGEKNGTTLRQEIMEQGYRGSERTVYRYLEVLKHVEVKACTRLHRLHMFSVNTAIWLFIRDPETLDEIEQEDLTAYCQASTTLKKAYDLVQAFVTMVHQHEGKNLESWLSQVTESGLPELQSFASGVEKDKDAVKAGLTWSINNGMVEGHVTKLKLIKRTMYGRAGFPLLRQRVLHAV